MRPPQELLYESESSLRLVDKAIDELSVEGGESSDSSIIEPSSQIVLRVERGKTWQESVIKQLDEFGIQRKELAAEIDVDPTQLSRWLVGISPETGRAISVGIDNAVMVQDGIDRILMRRDREKATAAR